MSARSEKGSKKGSERAKGSKGGAGEAGDISAKDLAKGIKAGDRTALGKALTLVESRLAEDRQPAKDLVGKLSDSSSDSSLGASLRIGITGIPGAGKSTMIDALGALFLEEGHKVAVLAVDPSSTKSGGAILGDKTRMSTIANHPGAFVRPSPAAGATGGVTRTSRESIAVLEAGGYDIIFVETVGVGQAELSAVDMVDFFIVLVIPGAGDELQGIKRGIVELADMIVVNKADSTDGTAVNSTVADYKSALNLLYPKNTPPVLRASALKGAGLKEIAETLKERHQKMSESGELEKIRDRQQIKWFRTLVENGITARFADDPKAERLTDELEAKIANNELSPGEAAELFLSRLYFRE